MDEANRPAAGNEEEYEPDLITLEDEAGAEHTFEILDAADMGEMHYLAMVPYVEDPAARLEEDAEMVIMRVGEEDGEEILDVIEDEEELYQVGQLFLQRLQDVYDIDLEELAGEMEPEQ